MNTTDICRVCMEDDGDNFSSLFISPTTNAVSPSVMIMDCAGVAVDKGDGLPETVCSECLHGLEEAYRIREKCRKTDRRLRKILNLAHKSQPVLDSAGECDERLSEAVAVCSTGIPVDASLSEPADGFEEPSLNIKTELQITSEETKEEEEVPNFGSSTFDQPANNTKCPTAESPVPSSNLSEHSQTYSGFSESPAISAKQKQIQHIIPINEQDYMIEELKENLELAEHSKSSVDKFEEGETNLHSNCDEAIHNDEEQSLEMEVEVLDDEECDAYEDYEAIDEDFDKEDFNAIPTTDIFVCCGCPMEFDTCTELNDHSRSIHLPECDRNTSLQDWFTCDICYKRHSSLKALNYHKTNRVNRRMRTCNVCQLVMNSVRKKRHHEQLHRLLPDAFKINCCGCDQIVPFKQLGAHAEQVHKNANQQSTSRFVCEVCFLDCGFKQRLDSHQSKQDIPEILVRRQTLCEDTFNAPVADIDGKQRFICDICEKNFSTKGNLKSHRALHGPSEKPFKCALCGRDFSKKSNYNVHMLRAHSTDSCFPCSECSKRFKCATNLKTHMRVHTKEKPYRCEFCSKAFGYLSDKRRHEIGHSGNYPFKCSLCGKPYTRKTLLDRHIQSCTNRLGIIKPVADVKVEALDSPEQDETHAKIKQMLMCDLCDDWFPTMEELADHHAEIHIQTLDEGTYDAEVEIE